MTSGGFDLTTPRFIQAARNHGLLLHYWTINDDADMEKLLSLGVDGIMTDRPQRLMDLR
jgi:glycerophosphoryl diester phosphodiesterase